MALESETVIFSLIVVAIGLALLFVGSLLTIATALGRKQYVFGICTLLFLPLSLIYCGLHWRHAAYPGKMVFSGTGLIVLGLLPIAWHYLQQG